MPHLCQTEEGSWNVFLWSTNENLFKYWSHVNIIINICCPHQVFVISWWVAWGVGEVIIVTRLQSGTFEESWFDSQHRQKTYLLFIFFPQCLDWPVWPLIQMPICFQELEKFYIHVAMHCTRFLLKNQHDALIIQIYCYKTLHVSGIFSAHHQGFSAVHSALISFMQVYDDRRMMHETYQCWMYSRKPLMLGREDARNMYSFITE
jgi:hypothetical protein